MYTDHFELQMHLQHPDINDVGDSEVIQYKIKEINRIQIRSVCNKPPKTTIGLVSILG